MIDSIISQQLAGSRTLQEIKGLTFIPYWNQPSNAGDTGGGSSLPHGSFIWTPGPTGTFTASPAVRGVKEPWDTYYCYNTLVTAPIQDVFFGYGLDFKFPTVEDIAACQAFELELEVCEAGLRYNMGWQYYLGQGDGGPGWRLYDMQHGAWVRVPGIPLPAPKAGTAVPVFAEYSLDRTKKTVTHEALTVDRTRYVVNSTHVAMPKWKPTTFYLHNAFQMDSKGKGARMSVELSNMFMRSL